jgi:hypothetical protein
MLGKRSASIIFFPVKDAQGGYYCTTQLYSMDLFISFHIRNIKLGKIKTFRELRSSIYFLLVLNSFIFMKNQLLI